jgi:acyl-CoA synthetase (AMP-forming)/AMP-acid ligase II
MTNIAEMLRLRAEKSPEKVALTYRGSQLTWNEVYDRAALVRRRLQDAGIHRGDVVAIYTDHSPAQVIALFAAAMADAVFTIVNIRLKHEQVQHQLTDSDTNAIIGTESYLTPFEDLFKHRQIHALRIGEEGLPTGVTPEEVPTSDLAETTANIPFDISNIIYTSGSTGRAKGVVVPHRTLLDGARIVSGYLKITAEDTIMSLLPFSFDYGLNQLMDAVYTGARLVLHRYHLPRQLLDELASEQATVMAAVPSLWPHLFNPRLVDHATKPEFEHLRLITTAGGQHSQELLKELVAFFPHTDITIMYGLTESFRSTYLPFSEIFKRPGSIGKAVPEVEILVINEDGDHCTPGEKGELYHRGAFITYGYLNDPELTESRFIHLSKGGNRYLPEYAVRSGDIVSLDEEGYIYFHGRADMQIKSSGYRVSPDEVSEAVLAFADISHAAVFSMPDPLIGEVVHLAYSTYSEKPVDQAELARNLKSDLPDYAIPRGIHFYKSLPLTTSGKIDVPAIRKDVGEGAS